MHSFHWTCQLWMMFVAVAAAAVVFVVVVAVVPVAAVDYLLDVRALALVAGGTRVLLMSVHQFSLPSCMPDNFV